VVSMRRGKFDPFCEEGFGHGRGSDEQRAGVMRDDPGPPLKSDGVAT